MKRILHTMPVALLVAGLALATTAVAASMDFTTYQMEFRAVSLDEARSVIDRTIGSGAVDTTRGEELLDRTRQHVLGASREWFDSHPDATIVGGVPFYGPRRLAVAYEYYIACGDEICGSIYDVFPDATTIDGAIDLYFK